MLCHTHLYGKALQSCLLFQTMCNHRGNEMRHLFSEISEDDWSYLAGQATHEYQIHQYPDTPLLYYHIFVTWCRVRSLQNTLEKKHSRKTKIETQQKKRTTENEEDETQK